MPERNAQRLVKYTPRVWEYMRPELTGKQHRDYSPGVAALVIATPLAVTNDPVTRVLTSWATRS
jgi:hypothetical protein